MVRKIQRTASGLFGLVLHLVCCVADFVGRLVGSFLCTFGDFLAGLLRRLLCALTGVLDVFLLSEKTEAAEGERECETEGSFHVADLTLQETDCFGPSTEAYTQSRIPFYVAVVGRPT